MDTGINFLAVLVATVAAYAVGWAWYGFLFQKQWMALMGFTEQSMRSMRLSATQAMILGFLSTLVSVYVLAVFVSAAPSVAGASVLVFWVWLGFVATTQLGSYLWEGKSIKLFLINASQSLVALFVAAIILVLWQ